MLLEVPESLQKVPKAFQGGESSLRPSWGWQMVENLLMLRSKFRSRNPVACPTMALKMGREEAEGDNGTHQERPQFVNSTDASAETDGGIRYVVGNERTKDGMRRRRKLGARVFPRG